MYLDAALHLHFVGSNIDIIESNQDYLTSVFRGRTENSHRKTHLSLHTKSFMEKSWPHEKALTSSFSSHLSSLEVNNRQRNAVHSLYVCIKYFISYKIFKKKKEKKRQINMVYQYPMYRTAKVRSKKFISNTEPSHGAFR